MSGRACRRHGAVPRQGCDGCRISGLLTDLASSQAEVARLDRERNALQGAYSSMLRQRDEAAAERDAALKRAKEAERREKFARESYCGPEREAYNEALTRIDPTTLGQHFLSSGTRVLLALERRALEAEAEVVKLVAQRSMTVHRLAGEVEGPPTHIGNFLQRIDALRSAESRAADLAREVERLRAEVLTLPATEPGQWVQIHVHASTPEQRARTAEWVKTADERLRDGANKVSVYLSNTVHTHWCACNSGGPCECGRDAARAWLDSERSRE